MPAYEYQVIPAPDRGVKAKGVKSPEARFSLALQDLMNEMGAQGWEYQRAETLPSVERTGLTGSTTNWRHVLVFRRELAQPATQPSENIDKISQPSPMPEPPKTPEHHPAAAAPASPPVPPTPPSRTAPVVEAKPTPPEQDSDHPAGQPGATVRIKDDGVEEVSDVAGVTTSLSTLAASRKNVNKSDV